MIIPLPIVGPTYVDRSVNVSFQECINWYPEVSEMGGKEMISLVGTPGLDSVSSITETGVTGIRGLHKRYDSTFLFVITGQNVFRVDPITEVATDIGNVSVDRTVLAISRDDGIVNNQQLTIAGNRTDTLPGKAYKITTSAVTDITSVVNATNPTHCAYINGYFLINDASGQTIYFTTQDPSDLSSSASWPAANVFSAEGKGDRISALIELNNELWLFGDDTYSIYYYDSNDSTTPFKRFNGSLRDVGIAARYSLAKNDTNLFWLSADSQGRGIVWTNEGYQPRRISTGSIENAIDGYTTISDAKGFTYQDDGHYFYVLTFPTENATWVYDMTTGMWHRRGYWNGNTSNQDRIRPNVGIFWNDRIVLGDWDLSQLYYYNLDTYTDNGDVIRRERSSPHVHKNRERVFFSSFELDMETGVGLQSGQGNDPQIALSISDDGGHTFGNEKWKDIGVVGAYKTRVKWNRLGASRNRVWKLVITDPVKCILIGAVADVE